VKENKGICGFCERCTSGADHIFTPILLPKKEEAKSELAIDLKAGLTDF
jgi:hypothetical protein